MPRRRCALAASWESRGRYLARIADAVNGLWPVTEAISGTSEPLRAICTTQLWRSALRTRCGPPDAALMSAKTWPRRCLILGNRIAGFGLRQEPNCGREDRAEHGRHKERELPPADVPAPLWLQASKLALEASEPLFASWPFQAALIGVRRVHRSMRLGAHRGLSRARSLSMSHRAMAAAERGPRPMAR